MIAHFDYLKSIIKCYTNHKIFLDLDFPKVLKLSFLWNLMYTCHQYDEIKSNNGTFFWPIYLNNKDKKIIPTSLLAIEISSLANILQILTQGYQLFWPNLKSLFHNAPEHQ